MLCSEQSRAPQRFVSCKHVRSWSSESKAAAIVFVHEPEVAQVRDDAPDESCAHVECKGDVDSSRSLMLR